MQEKTEKKVTLKPSQPAEDVLGVPSDFRKNSAGRLLIKKLMERIKDLDDQKFPSNPCFCLDGLCRLKAEKCKGISWKELVARSPEFFVRECHGIFLCWLMLSQPFFFSGLGERHIRNGMKRQHSDCFSMFQHHSEDVSFSS